MSEEMNNSLVCETVVSNNIFGGVGCETYTDRGIVGESAYEQAVAGGYTGTKQEFEQLLAYDLTTIADGIDDVVENLPAIQAASENADKAQKWAEGTDAQVTPLGGEHSAKGWANVAKGYADSIDLTNYRTSAAQDAIDITKQPKTLTEAISVEGATETTVEGALTAINNNRANKSLSNLDENGENHFADPSFSNINANAKKVVFPREFTPLNTLIAQGTAGIVGEYTLTDLPNDGKIRMALFTYTLETTQNGASSMQLETDCLDFSNNNQLEVVATNNGFVAAGASFLPIKQKITIKFGVVDGGVANSTRVILLGYF